MTRLIFVELCFPKVSAHIDVAVGLEGDALFLEEFALPLPTWSRASLDVDDSVTRQQLCSGRVAKRSPHHPCMARPTCQSCNKAVCHHTARRYLRHDAQHSLAKHPRLFCCHPVETIRHYIKDDRAVRDTTTCLSAAASAEAEE